MFVEGGHERAGLSAAKVDVAIRGHPEAKLFLRSHPARTTAKEEQAHTIQIGLENREAIEKWSEEAKNVEETWGLTELDYWMRSARDPSVQAGLAEVYATLWKFGISRDQNIFNPIMGKYVKPEHVCVPFLPALNDP